MDTLYIINGQTVYSFCFSTRCKTTRTTSLGVNKRTSTREVPNPLVIIIGVPLGPDEEGHRLCGQGRRDHHRG